MLEYYVQQYNRALRLQEKLCEKLSDLTGYIVPVYEKPHTPHSKVSLVQATQSVCKECDVLIAKIEIAEAIQEDNNIIDSMEFRLNRIEEVI